MNLSGTNLLIGVDIGTTKTKALLIGADGAEVASAQVPTPWRAVGTGAEAGPSDILAAVTTVLASVLDRAAEGEIVGLGVTSVAESLVLLGEGDRPVAPAIAWYDTRSRPESADLVAALGAENIAVRTGMGESEICGLAKLAWHVRHGGAPLNKALSVADWVVFALGGGPYSEASLASRTGALDLEARQWWADALAWAGGGPRLFPEVVQAGHRSGQVVLERLGANLGAPLPAGEKLRRLAGAALTSGGHDHLCAAAGLGALGPHQVLDSCGTAEAFVRSTAPLGRAGVLSAVRAGLNVGWHTVPDSHALVAGRSLGLVLDRVLALLGVSGTEAVNALDDAARCAPDVGTHLAEVGPYGNVSVLDVGPCSSPGALWRAALRHTQSGAASILRTMEDVAGPADELVLSGGWAHLRGVREGRSGLLRRHRWPAVTEGGARGAALFGGCAAGLFRGPAEWPVPRERAWS